MAFFVILGKEIRSLWRSPSTWLIAAAFAFAQALCFILSLRTYQTGAQAYDLAFLFFNRYPELFWLPFLFLFPLVTMRSFAEEERQGTIEPLMTTPISSSSVVLAKFFSCYFFYLLLWLPTLVYFLLFEQLTGQSPVHALEDGAPHWGGYIGASLILLCIGAAFVAIGCFCSALTSNQLAAAVLCFVILLLHLALGSIVYVYDGLSPALRQVIEYINSLNHLNRFSQGQVSLTALCYYLSLAIGLVYLTRHLFDLRRWQR